MEGRAGERKGKDEDERRAGRGNLLHGLKVKGKGVYSC